MLGLRFGYLAGAVGIGILSFVLSLVVITFILVSLPSTFFLESHVRDLWIDRHPIVRWSGHILKNLAGLLVIVLGLFLSVPGIPGQGLLTLLIGVMLMDIPGKIRFERWVLSQRRVRATVNRLRAGFGKPALVFDEPKGAGQNEA